MPLAVDLSEAAAVLVPLFVVAAGVTVAALAFVSLVASVLNSFTSDM